MAHPSHTRLQRGGGGLPTYVEHPSFLAADAEMLYDAAAVLGNAGPDGHSHMVDEVTRDCARRMHYAAFRLHQAGPRQARRWRPRYLALRDRIVLGNQKLVFRAVHKWMAFAHRADDMIGEGYLVLIRAVAAYNPWLGIRFSTYAVTCLMRALSRLTHRYASDWLSHSMVLDAVADPAVRGREEDCRAACLDRVGELLDSDHPLLTEREKFILTRRYQLCEENAAATLEEVGRALGLSKERVRQVQASALSKLREALLATTPG